MYGGTKRTQLYKGSSGRQYPLGYFKDKECKNCNKIFSPRQPSHLFCSEACADYIFASRYLKKIYGITIDDFNKMYEDQKGLCAICGGEGFYMKGTHLWKIVVDHCHTTGKVRGLLCHNCNRALGLLQDKKSNLINAINYLERATTIP